MSDKFVVSTNTVGEIIVTDTETGNIYHYGNMGNFLGLIRLLNEQQATIQSLKEENEQLKSDIMLIEKNADRHYEENKQLKKELNEYRQVIIDKVQYYEDNLEDFLIKKGVIKEDWARFDDYD